MDDSTISEAALTLSTAPIWPTDALFTRSFVSKENRALTAF